MNEKENLIKNNNQNQEIVDIEKNIGERIKVEEIKELPEENKTSSKKKFLFTSFSTSTLIIWFVPLLLLVIFVVYFLFIIINIFWWILKTWETQTSLSYFEADNFYWLPYQANFKWENADLSSIFKNNKEFKGVDIPKKVEEYNNLLKKELDKLTVRTISEASSNKFDCWNYCDMPLSSIIDVQLVVDTKYEYQWHKITNVINAELWKSGIHYIALKVKNKENNKDYNSYLYTIAQPSIAYWLKSKLDFEGATLVGNKYKTIEPRISEYEELYEMPLSTDKLTRIDDFYKKAEEIKTIVLRPKTYNEINFFDSSTYRPKFDNADLSQKIALTNIKKYIKDYYLSKDAFIFNVAWQSFHDIHDKIYVEWMDYIFKNWKTALWKKIRDFIFDVVNKDYSTLYDSNIVDMLNYAWINNSTERFDSQSNQFLLSQEKIDLSFFQKRNFGKNYKDLIFYPNTLQEIKYEDIAKILIYDETDETSKHSNEFWFYIENDIGFNLGDNYQTKTPATNDKPIKRIGDVFFSDEVKVPTRWNSVCSVITPAWWESNIWYVPYTKEAIYSWQRYVLECITSWGKWKNGKKWKSKITREVIDAPPLIQKASIVYYKKFLFQDENPFSERNRKDYYLNYFYDKSYIPTNSDIYSAVNLVNNIYLDRNSILFNGIYMRISWFWIEIKDWGRLIVSKKSSDWYENLLNEAPIKIEIGILTDLDKSKKEVLEFDDNNNPYKDKFKPKDNVLYNHSAAWNDTEVKLYNYNRMYDLDKENSLLKSMEKSSFRGNNQKFRSNKLAEWHEMFDNLDLKWNFQEELKTSLLMYIENDLITNHKNNYFYDSVKMEKLIHILDEIYQIRKIPEQTIADTLDWNINISNTWTLNSTTTSSTWNTEENSWTWNISSNWTTEESWTGSLTNWSGITSEITNLDWLNPKKEENIKDKADKIIKLNKSKNLTKEELNKKKLLNTFKKFIILNNDIFSCWPLSLEECYIVKYNREKNKAYFNENRNFWKFYFQTFDMCWFYKDFKNIENLVVKKDNSAFSNTRLDARALLLEPCYRQWFRTAPFVATLKNDEHKPMLDAMSNSILNKFEYWEIITSLAKNWEYKTYDTPINPYLYKNLPSKLVEISSTSKDWDINYDLQVYNIFKHIEEKKTESLKNEEILTELWTSSYNNTFPSFSVANQVYDLFYNPDKNNLDVVWNAYTQLPEYQSTCIDKTMIDDDIFCSKEDVYKEFLDIITQTPKYYNFIKEEYLQEEIQDEPFFSYYNWRNLKKCDYWNCVSQWTTASSDKFLSPVYSKYKYRLPIHQQTYDAWDRELSMSDNDTYNNNVLEWNSVIKDYTYNLNLNKAFSYKPENYSYKLDLHTIAINPNVYLYSFMKWMEEKKDKYRLNFYWSWFDSVLAKINKKHFEAEFFRKTNYYFSDVSLFRLYSDTYKILTLLAEVNNNYAKNVTNEFITGDYSLLKWNYLFQKYISNTTVWDNIESYINNIHTNKTISEIYKIDELNKDNINSLNLININKSKIKNFYWNKEERIRLINRLLHSIYLGSEQKQIMFKKLDAIWDQLNKFWSANPENILNWENWFFTEKYDYIIREHILANLWIIHPSNLIVLDSNTGFAWFIRRITLPALTWAGNLATSKEYVTNSDYINRWFDDMYKFTMYNHKANEPFVDKNDTLSVYNNYKFEDFERFLYGSNIERINSSSDIYNRDLYLIPKDSFTKDGVKYDISQIDFLKEKVLLLENYNWDISQVWKDYTWKTDNELRDLISRQLPFIKYLKSTNYTLYNKYYYKILKDAYSHDSLIRKIQTNTKFAEELRQMFEEYKTAEKFFTSYEDYIDYMYLISAWIKPYLDLEKEDNLIITLNNVLENHEYSASNKTTIWNIYDEYVFTWNSDHFAIYNFLNDMFLWSSDKSGSYPKKQIIINAKSFEQKEIEKFKKLLEEHKKEKKKTSDKKIDEQIVHLEWLIREKEEKNKYLWEKDYYILEYNPVSNSFRYSNKLIKVDEKWKESSFDMDFLKESVDKEDYNKFLFFTWPLDWYHYKSWFFFNGWFRDLYLESLTNSYLNFFFWLANVRQVENGIKKIISETDVFTDWEDFNKIKSFKNIDNLWNFYYMYTNTWYVDANNSTDALRFEILLSDWFDIDDPSWQIYNWPNIFSLRGSSAKNVINQRLDQLKTEHCQKYETSSKQQNCEKYIDFLKSMSLSEINAEMEYLTWYQEVKHLKQGNGAFVWHNPNFSYLAGKYKWSPEVAKIFKDYAQKNRFLIWQCTWYANLLKDYKCPSPCDWKFVYKNLVNAWFPGDTFNSRTESPEAIFNKIQEWDVISWRFRKNSNDDTYWHVWVVKKKIKDWFKIIVVEANIHGTGVVTNWTYYASNLWVWWVVHWVKWKY